MRRPGDEAQSSPAEQWRPVQRTEGGGGAEQHPAGQGLLQDHHGGWRGCPPGLQPPPALSAMVGSQGTFIMILTLIFQAGPQSGHSRLRSSG